MAALFCKACGQSNEWGARHDCPGMFASRAPAVAPQCCMCGKVGLSTAEGDGGGECELHDGRWTCSRVCWDRACDPAPSDGLREENERLRRQLRMIVSHATMGETTGEGMSVNDISVKITALRNELYQAGKDAALSAPAQEGGRTVYEPYPGAWRGHAIKEMERSA